MLVACECGKIRDINVFPVYCTCGRVTDGTNQIYKTEYQCKFRKQNIGKLNCGCQGNTNIYKCDLFEYCAIRKLKPGTLQNVEIDGQKKRMELKYCNSCESREE